MNTFEKRMSTIVKHNRPSLDSLPVEILYRILDDVDGQTIVLSFRNVCTKFEAVANSYNQYKLDLTSISNTNFDFVCHHIRAENIIELTLSNDRKTPDEINRFFSLVDIDRLIRLRSLTFLQVNNNELQTHLHSILTISPLTSLSIKSKDDDELDARSLLLSIITQSNLHRLDFNIDYYGEIKEVSWPVDCTLVYLRMNTCTIQQFCAILDHSPNLRTLVLKHCSQVHFGTPVIKTYSQLTSLTFEKFKLYVHYLEIILAHTPSLIHLKVVNDDDASGTLFDGSRWENFIRMKLPQLKNFQFFFSKIRSLNGGSAEMESLIGPFRTPFWSETKQWTVAFAYLKHIRQVILCSLPVCLTSFTYYCGFQESGDPDQQLYSTKSATIKETDSNQYLFDNLTELNLNLYRRLPVRCINVLSRWIDLSHVIELSLTIRFFSNSMRQTMADVTTLFEGTYNLRSLKMFAHRPPSCRMKFFSGISTILPRRLEHLKINITNVDEMIMIFKQLVYLSSIAFEWILIETISSADIIDWLNIHLIDFSFRTDEEKSCVYVWLGKYINKSSEIKRGAKRVKLAHNHH